MAATSQLTRITDADDENDGGTWDKLGKTTSPTTEVDFYYQGDTAGTPASISGKVGTTLDGVDFDATAAIDVTTPRTFLFKILASNNAALVVTGSAIEVRIGSAPGDYYTFQLAGEGGIFGNSSGLYPPLGGWQIVPIDMNVVAHRMSLTGSAPTLTIIDYFGFAADFLTTAKAENFAIDAIDYVTVGEGLSWTGSGGSFQDFLDLDEGDLNNRWGLVFSREGIIFVTGTLSLADSSISSFVDAGKVLVWPDGLVNTGFNGMFMSLIQGDTFILLDDCVFKGRGKDARKVLFDTELDVLGGAADDITIGTHDWKTGDEVLYSKEGGTEAIGLTDATAYYIIEDTATTVQVATTKANAVAGTAIGLTPSSIQNGDEHSFLRRPSTRPNLGTSAGQQGSATFTGCTFDSWNDLVPGTGFFFISCIFLSARTIVQDSADFTNCRFSGGVLLPGDVLLDSDANLQLISGCDFTQGIDTVGGHALEYSGTPTAGFTFTGNTFNGYGPNRAQFLTDATGVDAAGEDLNFGSAHGLSTGDVVYYNKEGGTAAIGLTDGARYYVNVISTTNLSMHLTEHLAQQDLNRINLTASGAETHSLYSGTAAIYNSNSSGTLTITLAGGGDSPSIRNAPGATTIIVTASVTTTITVTDHLGALLENARVLLRAATGGPEPFEESVTIARSGTVATVSHTGHGFGTSDKVQIKGITDKTGDNTVQTIVTVPDANSYTYTTTDSGSTSYTGTIVATAVFIDGLTNASGIVTDTRPFASDQPIGGFIRKSSASPRFKTFSFTGNVIDVADGLTLAVRMVLDE